MYVQYYAGFVFSRAAYRQVPSTGLADDDSACLTKEAHDGSICGWLTSLFQHCAIFGWHVGCVDDVFNADWNAEHGRLSGALVSSRRRACAITWPGSRSVQALICGSLASMPASTPET